MSNINNLLNKMWVDYIATNPEVQKIHNLFLERGDLVENDHIALRTFNHPRVNISVIEKPFLASGYTRCGEYEFIEKKLQAAHYEHSDKTMPKVFISELELEKFDESLSKIVNKLIEQVSDDVIASFDFTTSGRPWECSISQYENLFKMSPYAAWIAALGYRPNHFTIFINKLKSIDTIETLNKIIKEAGYKLNDAGGEIKGSEEVCLKQSSTLAMNSDIEFSDGFKSIPVSYYEFASRFPDESGELYQGFVAKSADKIFESTDKGQ